MSIFSIFGSKKVNSQLKEMYEAGAVILDVRTAEEFKSGHVKGSKNIPVQVLQNKVNTVKAWNKPVITCCRSGARSGMASSILSGAGITCINGGSWQEVQSSIA